VSARAWLAEQIDEALAAVVEYRKWREIEDERFAAWIRGEKHGNSVRRAEATATRRMYRAIDLVFPLARDLEREGDDRLAQASATDVASDESLDVLRSLSRGLDNGGERV